MPNEGIARLAIQHIEIGADSHAPVFCPFNRGARHDAGHLMQLVKPTARDSSNYRGGRETKPQGNNVSPDRMLME